MLSNRLSSQWQIMRRPSKTRKQLFRFLYPSNTILPFGHHCALLSLARWLRSLKIEGRQFETSVHIINYSVQYSFSLRSKCRVVSNIEKLPNSPLWVHRHNPEDWDYWGLSVGGKDTTELLFGSPDLLLRDDWPHRRSYLPHRYWLISLREPRDYSDLAETLPVFASVWNWVQMVIITEIIHINI